VFPADEGDDLVHFVRRYFARTRYVAGVGQKDVGRVSETTCTTDVPVCASQHTEYGETDLLRAPPCVLRTEWTWTISRPFSSMRPRLVRALSTRASAVYADPANAHVPALASTPPGLTHRQRAILESALRVDHAGEIAANYIYKGQMAVLGRHPTVGPLIQVRVARHRLPFILVDRPLRRKCGIRKNDTSLSWTNFKYNTRFGPQCSPT